MSKRTNGEWCSGSQTEAVDMHQVNDRPHGHCAVCGRKVRLVAGQRAWYVGNHQEPVAVKVEAQAQQ